MQKADFQAKFGRLSWYMKFSFQINVNSVVHNLSVDLLFEM